MVIPARSPRYAFAYPSRSVITRPGITARRVNSVIVMFSGTYGLCCVATDDLESVVWFMRDGPSRVVRVARLYLARVRTVNGQRSFRPIGVRALSCNEAVDKDGPGPVIGPYYEAAAVPAATEVG